MRPTSLAKLALIGIALISATAAQAATEAQAATAANDAQAATEAQAVSEAEAAVPAKAAPTEADWTTTLNVKLALLRKLGTDTLHLDVDSLGGTVRLTGTVDKRETKELAGTVAMSVRGVHRVENGIRLEAAVANPSQAGAAVGEADAEVKDAVLETKLRLALINKMGSDGFKIGTDAANGVVTLSFDSAFNSDSRERAVAIATDMRGVSKVVAVDKTVDKT
jgi:osmotically-inducible protein OsmY